MKRILLAGALALVATQAHAGFSTRQWYEGKFTCKIADSPDRFEAYITTQRGQLTGWGHLMKAPGSLADHIQPRGNIISFYVDSNPRAYVELQRRRVHWGPNRGRYSGTLTGKLVMNGKRHELSCTRR